MNHLLKIVAPLALAPMLMGAGGDAPLPAPGDNTYKFTGDMFVASILLDPHNDGVSSSAKMASIQVFNKQGNRLLASAEFKVLPGKIFDLGCTLSNTQFPDLTATRFLFDPPTNLVGLDSWVPEATVRFLFEPLGITNLRNPAVVALPEGAVAPVITAIGAADCVTDARQDSMPPTDSTDKLLLMQDVVIEFVKLVPPKN